MNLFILAFFCLVLAVSSESEKLKTNTVEDQKNENSAFLQKFIRPNLKHDVRQRYGVNREHLVNNILRNDHRFYDYTDDHDEEHARNYGGPRELHNVQNIFGYSRLGGSPGSLVNHAYNGDPNVWGYLRNAEGIMRNAGNHKGQAGHSRHEGRPRNMGHVYIRPRSRTHINMMVPEINTMGPEIMGYGNIGREDMGLQKVLLNINELLQPDDIGFVGQVHPNGKGIHERFDFTLVGPDGLGFHQRTALPHGLSSPMTPSLLSLLARKSHVPHLSK